MWLIFIIVAASLLYIWCWRRMLRAIFYDFNEDERRSWRNCFMMIVVATVFCYGYLLFLADKKIKQIYRAIEHMPMPDGSELFIKFLMAKTRAERKGVK